MHKHRKPATEEPPWKGQYENYCGTEVGGGGLNLFYSRETLFLILTQLWITNICSVLMDISQWNTNKKHFDEMTLRSIYQNLFFEIS